MNCSNCGAENDVDAHFCAECGTPLDNVAVETAKAEHVFSDTDEDATIMSAPGEIAMEAKTLAVGQTNMVADVEDANNAEEVDDDSSSSEPESPPSSSGASPADAGSGDQDGDGMDHGGGGGDGQKGSNRTMIIVGAIVLVLFLCCCCSVLVGGVVGSDPDMIEDLIEKIAMLPH